MKAKTQTWWALKLQDGRWWANALNRPALLPTKREINQFARIAGGTATEVKLVPVK